MSSSVGGKRALRGRILKCVKSLGREEITRQSIVARDVVLPLLTPGLRVACFMSMDHEIDTNFVINVLFKQGNKVFLPRCTDTKKTGQQRLRKEDHPHLTFHQMDSYSEVIQLKPAGKYKLREPPEEIPAPLPPKLDAILVPGVAFSPVDGSRIGYGAGYYDDFFKRYQLQHDNQLPLLIGYALKEQLCENIPTEPHDYKMDCIVTGDGKIHWIKQSMSSLPH